jgi:hypothetical protein
MSAKRSSHVRSGQTPNRDPSLGSKGARVGISFRLARRIAIQSPGRSILIALLIALPIVGLSGVDTVEASQAPTPQTHARFELGQNAGLLTMVSPPDPTLRQDPLDPLSIEQKTDNKTGDPVASEHGAKVLLPSAILPAGTRIIPVQYVNIVAHTKTGIGSFTGLEGSVWGRSFAGMYDLAAGRRPAAPDEVMLTPSGLARFGVAIGDHITIQLPRAETLTVVGTLSDSTMPNTEVELFGEAGAFGGTTADADLTSAQYFLPKLSLSWTEIRALNAQGAVVLSRRVLLDPPPVSVAPRLTGTNPPNTIGILFISLLGAFALFEVCLLAGAAFAVGARHQQRMLAILSSVGGDRRTLFRVISFGGIILGLAGGVLGSILGVVVAWFAIPVISNGNPSAYPNFHADLPVLLIIIAASTISGWIAAAVPARTAARTDVVAALRGTQRPPRTSSRRPIAGIVVVIAGAGLAIIGGVVTIAAYQHNPVNQTQSTTGIVLLVAGPIIMQIGVILIVPLLLRWTMVVLSRLGVGARLGARDASRNPSRTVPAVAAIMSTVFVSSLVFCLIGGAQVATIRDYQWSAPLNLAQVSMYSYNSDNTQTRETGAAAVAAAVNKSYGVTDARVISSTPDANSLGTTVPYYVVTRMAHPAPNSNDYSSYLNSCCGSDHLTVGSPADLATILGEPVTSKSLATLRAGGVVSLWSNYVDKNHVMLDWFVSGTDPGQPKGKPVRSVTVPAVVQRSQHAVDYGIFMLPSTATSLKIPFSATGVIAQLSATPTPDERDGAYGAIQAIDPKLQPPQVETGPQHFGAEWYWGLLALTTLIALGASVVALSLARADGRRDDGVLDSIGSPPLVRRSFGFAQGAIIAGLGSIIGVVLGLVPAYALGLPVAKQAQGFIPFAPPWLQLALTALALPLLIAVIGWLLAGRVKVRWNARTPIG